MSYQGPPQQPLMYAPPSMQPRRQSFWSTRMIAGMVLGIVGGLLVMMSIFVGFMSMCQESGVYGFTYSICLSVGPAGANYLGMSAPVGAEFAYGYLLPVFGILILVFAILTPTLRKRPAGVMTHIFSLSSLIIAVVLCAHFMARGYSSFGLGTASYSISMLPGIGFFFALIGAVLGIVGGLLMIKQLEGYPQPFATQVPAGSPYGAPAQYQPPPPQPPQY